MAKPVYTPQEIADQLTRSGLHWSSTTITYSFPATAGGTSYSVDATQQAWIDEAISIVGDILGVTFIKVSSSSASDIKFVNDTGNGTYASTSYYLSDHSIASSTIYLDQTWSSNQSANLDYGSYGFVTIIHEFLHALGLSHPGDYNAGSGGPITYANDAEFAQDTHRFSVMSYFNAYSDGSGTSHYFWNGSGYEWIYPQSPMVYDILALQTGNYAGYFAGYAAGGGGAGDTVYGYNSTASQTIFDFTINDAPVLTIYDTSGTDTLDLSGDTQTVALAPIYDVDGNITGWQDVSATYVRIIDLNEGSYSSTHGLTNNIGIAFGTVIENAIGTGFADIIYGNDVANLLKGGGGDDELWGNGGNDTLYANAGNDLLYGGEGDDKLSGQNGNDVLHGEAGADILYGGKGLDVVWGGENNDTLYGNAGADILHGDNGNDTLWGQNDDDVLFGEAGLDVLIGGNGDDTLWGQDDNDTLYGKPGNDTLNGGNGDDFLSGQNGDDVLNGGAGDDILYGGNGSDDLWGNDSDDILYANAGNDVLHGGAGNDILWGQNEDDVLYGEAGFDVLIGGNGNDILWGQDDDDILYGKPGDDFLDGANGNDVLAGQLGVDVLTGGAGADQFVMAEGDGADTVTDFEAGIGSGDVIDVTDFGFLTYQDLFDAIADTADGALVTFNAEDSLLLLNVLKADLVEDDFLIA